MACQGTSIVAQEIVACRQIGTRKTVVAVDAIAGQAEHVTRQYHDDSLSIHPTAAGCIRTGR